MKKSELSVWLRYHNMTGGPMHKYQHSLPTAHSFRKVPRVALIT